MEKFIEKKEMRFDCVGVFCEIVFRTNECMKKDLETYPAGGIWNSYFAIRKKDFEKEFKKLNINKYDKYGRCKYEILEENEIVDMHGGITFYEKRGYEIKTFYHGNINKEKR